MTNSHTPHAPRARRVPRAAATLALTALATLAATAPARAADDTMPNVNGKSLSAAYQALHNNKDVQLQDGRGAGRHVLWPANWKVCAQHPQAGAPLQHQKVKLTVVKSRELCGNGR
ncbi:PASTA domain-containing protein [Streptomyces sp. NPDC057743]|uniref:PASTA domain-containing protein n=1 Tax=Streptomyces sp. NPDC057743 TaxID=3346236 RepID=UPI0036C4EFD8